MEPEICMGILKALSVKMCSKCPSTALGYSMVRIAHLDDAFPEIPVSPLEGQSLWQKRKGGKKNEKRIDVNHFLFA